MNTPYIVRMGLHGFIGICHPREESLNETMPRGLAPMTGGVLQLGLLDAD